MKKPIFLDDIPKIIWVVFWVCLLFTIIHYELFCEDIYKVIFFWK